MTQRILSAMDSDNVNSISDTLEATQVASVIRDSYFRMVASGEYSFEGAAFQLDSATAAAPTKMKIPDNISNIDIIKYDKKTSTGTDRATKEIIYLLPGDFMDLLDKRNSSSTTVTEITDSSGIKFNISNNVAPTFYTAIDDEFIIMDSYDSVVESFLQSSKTTCIGEQEPTFSSLLDSTIPVLPSRLFPLLLAESQATAFDQVKQMQDPKSEQWARKLRIKSRREETRLSIERGDLTSPNYGRK